MAVIIGKEEKIYEKFEEIFLVFLFLGYDIDEVNQVFLFEDFFEFFLEDGIKFVLKKLLKI